jgi:hypothetical protein
LSWDPLKTERILIGFLLEDDITWLKELINLKSSSSEPTEHKRSDWVVEQKRTCAVLPDARASQNGYSIFEYSGIAKNCV